MLASLESSPTIARNLSSNSAYSVLDPSPICAIGDRGFMALLSFAIASAIPSFSANQARVEDERVWAELGISVLWHSYQPPENLTPWGFPTSRKCDSMQHVVDSRSGQHVSNRDCAPRSEYFAVAGGGGADG